MGAQAAAMQAAAENKNGAAMGFMGMNMANSAGGVNAQSLFQMGQQSQPAAGNGNIWRCSGCGTETAGNFCPSCGARRPAPAAAWRCSCGAENKGRFCTECGAKKPEGVPQYKCDKCGWEPADPTKPPKFCPQCGDPFDSGDMI